MNVFQLVKEAAKAVWALLETADRREVLSQAVKGRSGPLVVESE